MTPGLGVSTFLGPIWVFRLVRIGCEPRLKVVQQLPAASKAVGQFMIEPLQSSEFVPIVLV